VVLTSQRNSDCCAVGGGEPAQPLPAAWAEVRRRVRGQRLIVVLPGQCPYRSSFDLHLRFYLYRHSLHGDWLIVEDQPPCASS
jgi:hypothetical protein